MDELLNDFIVETTESLQQVDVDLVALEADPSDTPRVDGIFRLVHTIKGTSGFMNLRRLEKVAHAGENVLGLMRDKTIAVDSDGVSVVLMAVDRVRELIEAVGNAGEEPSGSDDDVLTALDNYMRAALDGGSDAAEETAPEPEPAETEAEAASDKQLDDMSALAGEVSLEELDRLFAETEVEDNAEAAFAALAAMDLENSDGDEAPAAAAPVAPAEAAAKAEPVKAAAAEPAKAEPDAAAAVMKKAEAARAEAKAAEGAAKGEAGQAAGQSIRVSVDLLEDLMTMVSELVLTRNQLLQLVRGQTENAFSVPLQRLNQITTDLQEGVMKARMQPIGNAWSKLPRIVRDLAKELNKDIRLDMFGQDTELDRQVLELIKDPLTHMVRNSGDHGIETPDVREAAGKPRQGVIRLDARHEGGQIVIELIDDGKGLDLNRIREKAISKGLISAEDAEMMTEKQIGRYIFHPGFSTAEAVTSVSGRGVGMDVVKTNIEKIGGTVDLTTQVGKGTTFQIKIPLTLAIVSSLIVEAAGERFAVPQMSVLELVRTSSTSEHRIENIEDTPVLRLRDQLLPLVRLSDALKLDGGEHKPESYVVVTQVASYRFGIIVDGVFDTEEIVVKPVAPVLRSIPMFSGNTILGDGSVVMILDPNGLARHTSESSTQTDINSQDDKGDQGEETRSMLIFYAGDQEPKALPLSLIARLEEFEADQIETVNGQAVVNYRDALIPVLSFDNAQLKKDEPQPAIVFMEQGQAIGLAIDRIIDIVEENFTVGLKSHNAGCLGTAILRGKATNVVDLSYFVEKANAIWKSAFGKAAAYNRPRRALIVEDSPFFRNVLRPILEAEGYNVIMASDPLEAIDTLEDGVEFDIIVSDIEMPNMNGFEFAEYLQKSPWADVPVIAVTSRFNEDDRLRGEKAGFDGFMRKLDQPALVDELRRHAVDIAKRKVA